jgi:hypothetical protein
MKSKKVLRVNSALGSPLSRSGGWMGDRKPTAGAAGAALLLWAKGVS